MSVAGCTAWSKLSGAGLIVVRTLDKRAHDLFVTRSACFSQVGFMDSAGPVGWSNYSVVYLLRIAIEGIAAVALVTTDAGGLVR